jgi:hypothetical protein
MTKGERPMKCAICFWAGVALLLSGVGHARADLILTPAGQAAGFRLSTFATGFPTAGGVPKGPVGIAFPSTGGVVVSDFAGEVRWFPSDSDGQNASLVPDVNNYGLQNALGMAQIGSSVYLARGLGNEVDQLNGQGVFQRVLAQTNPYPSSLAVDPVTGELFASVSGPPQQVVAIDPQTGKSRVFPIGGAGEHIFNPDGTILYVAATSNDPNGNAITGYDSTTGAVVFGPVVIPGLPYGISLGTGSLSRDIFVSYQFDRSSSLGGVLELNMDTLSTTLIATGGSNPGVFDYADPNNGSLLLGELDYIDRLTAPPGGGFYAPAPVPEPSTLALLGIGAISLAGYALRRRRLVSA